MAPQLDSGQMQPPVSHAAAPTVVAEVRLELQHLLLEALPVPVAAETEQLQRVRQLAVGEAVHREPLRVVVVRHLGQVVAAVLRVTVGNEHYRRVLRKALQTQPVAAGKLDHKVHVAAEGFHLAPVWIVAIGGRGRRSLQVRKRRAGVVALLHVRGSTRRDSTGDDDLGLHNDIANAADKRVVVDAVFRSAFRTYVRLKMNPNTRSDLPASSNLDHISRRQRCIVFCEMLAFISRFLQITAPDNLSLRSMDRPQRTLP